VSLADERGFEKVKRPGNLHHNLRWVVLYQVAGKNFIEIAKKTRRGIVDSGRKTVSSGVKIASKFIRLPLRPPDLGAAGKR
jgi:hypothetical protein